MQRISVIAACSPSTMNSNGSQLEIGAGPLFAVQPNGGSGSIAEPEAPALMHPAADDVQHLWALGRAVNSVRDNGPELFDRSTVRMRRRQAIPRRGESGLRDVLGKKPLAVVRDETADVGRHDDIPDRVEGASLTQDATCDVASMRNPITNSGWATKPFILR